jgi:hypothetical protein
MDERCVMMKPKLKYKEGATDFQRRNTKRKGIHEYQSSCIISMTTK